MVQPRLFEEDIQLTAPKFSLVHAQPCSCPSCYRQQSVALQPPFEQSVFAEDVLDLFRIPRLQQFRTIGGAIVMKSERKKKAARKIYDSLIVKRCSHKCADWADCHHSWHYHVTVGTPPVKHRGVIPNARSYDEAKRAYALIEDNVRNGRPDLDGFAQPEHRTIEQASEEWLSLPRDRKASTIDGHRTNMRAYILPVLGHRLVTEPTRQTLEILVRDLQPANREEPLSERTKEIVATTLQAFFSWVEFQGWREDNPAKQLGRALRNADVAPESYTVDKNDRDKYFTFDESQHLLDVTERKFPEWFDLILLGLTTGMRMGEICGLHFSDVNFYAPKPYIYVRHNYTKGRWTTPKTGKARMVQIPRTLLTRLRFRRRWRKDKTVDYVFVNSKGNAVDSKWFLRGPWKEIMAACEFEGRTPNAMRHAHSTQLLMRGESIVAVAVLTGRSPEETFKTYFHWLPSESRVQVDALADDLLGDRHIRVSPAGSNGPQEATSGPEGN
jgi:integrase